VIAEKADSAESAPTKRIIILFLDFLASSGYALVTMGRQAMTKQAMTKEAVVLLRKKLDQSGAHLTRQRAAVYEYLRQAEQHPTAEEVFLAVKATLPKISLATVYKNLEALVACGLAAKWTYGDAAARYDIRTDHHYHARCLRCGRLSDLEPTASKALSKQVQAPPGFRVEDYRIELVGYCRNCQP
jgi:Fe2+ or Zn2+ uptake regulation protein